LVLAAAAIGGYDLVNVHHQVLASTGAGRQAASIGWGLYVELVSAFIAFVAIVRADAVRKPVR
jgi:hypothetical protein